MENQLQGRERTEWANFWYDEADRQTERRILLIGDSTGRQIRRTLSGMTHRPVDFFGTSAALRDVLFWNQLDCFLKDSLYSYDNIIIWIGNHSRITQYGQGPFQEKDYEDFRNDFEKLLQYTRNISPNLLVLSSYDIVIPCQWAKSKIVQKLLEVIKIKYKCKVNTPETDIVNRKNSIIEEICRNSSTPFLDICAIMKQTSYNRTDHIHYEKPSNGYVCRLIADHLK